MGIKSILAKPLAAIVSKQIKKWASQPVETQQKVFSSHMAVLAQTAFGRDHGITATTTYEQFKKQVPVRDYEALRPYLERVVAGEEDVTWKGKPLYLSKTSGTTSGVKYIPISKESMPNHINCARNALLMYINETGNAAFIDGGLIFLSGSPELDKKNGIFTGRLSGIVNHHVPQYLRRNQLPSYTTNCIDDWETKVDAIVGETVNKDMTLISGIPPWVQMYFDKLTEKTGKKIKDIFPNFSVFVYGGVNFEPYRKKLIDSIGKQIDTIETYPASEGFIAFQDSQKEEGLLLVLNEGIFFEFIPTAEYFDENPTRISLKDVQVGVNYAVILNTNAGLWGYSIGDTVKFVSTAPYRLVVTGRIKHFISAFGEHVIGEEVEHALMSVAAEEGVDVIEFTVAPYVSQTKGQSYHEWFVEFGTEPKDLAAFAKKVDEALQKKNVYYYDLIVGNILLPLKLNSVPKNTFINYMKAEGKLGGQNKVPRLSNDRKIADKLTELSSQS
ncbi:MAG: GH3 auxin-responsive promoter family protein [Bacteroidetes bacterium]|nr:MAG: GH3 auxin-responsive promoter family protein [Bacteroidota bacterium]